MNTKNALQKRIIEALASAPKTALQELYKTATPQEREHIRSISAALHITLDDNTTQ